MKATEVILGLFCVVLLFFCYDLRQRLNETKKELEYCQDHPVQNAVDYYLDEQEYQE